MSTFFALAVFLSFIGFIVGIFNPKLVIKWGVDEKKNRKNVLRYYGLAIIIFAILFVATLPKSESKDKSVVGTNEQNSKVEQNNTNNEEVKKKSKEKVKTKETVAEADNYFNKGQKLLNKLDSNSAIEYFNKAITINPNNAKYYSAKVVAISLADPKNYAEQIQCLNKAIELDPNNATHYISKALVMSDLKRYDEALINSDKAITLAPKNETGYMAKGKILATLKRFSDEIACYKDLAKNVPAKQQFYELMEKTYRDSGKIQ